MLYLARFQVTLTCVIFTRPQTSHVTYHVINSTDKARDVPRDRLPFWELPLSETPEHDQLKDTVT